MDEDKPKEEYEKAKIETQDINFVKKLIHHPENNAKVFFFNWFYYTC